MGGDDYLGALVLDFVAAVQEDGGADDARRDEKENDGDCRPPCSATADGLLRCHVDAVEGSDVRLGVCCGEVAKLCVEMLFVGREEVAAGAWMPCMRLLRSAEDASGLLKVRGRHDR